MKPILGWLLHHANRHSRAPQFYAIKKRVLAAYGKVIGQDIQFIAGKVCRRCDGTGEVDVDCWGDYLGADQSEDCYACDGTGWWKSPKVVTLDRVQLGKYTFHQPVHTAWRLLNELPENAIKGPIRHTPTKYGEFCLRVLILLYNPAMFYRHYIKPYLPKRPVFNRADFENTDADMPF